MFMEEYDVIFSKFRKAQQEDKDIKKFFLYLAKKKEKKINKRKLMVMR